MRRDRDRARNPPCGRCVGGEHPQLDQQLIGAWLFVSAFTLAESQQAAWNVEIAGVVVFFLAIWSASATEGRRTVV
jgi:SPW repeat-containing protein